jgi:predicted nuclease of restriction endonuclease-like (RecB) superfamily
MKDFVLNTQKLFTNIFQLIEDSKNNVAIAVNAELTMLYWNIGKLIKDEILKNERAGYGKRIVETLSRELMAQYGKGWSERHLHSCMKLYDIFSDPQIVHTLCAELSWSHIRIIMGINDELKRNFYIEICKIEKWSVRLLQNRINSMLYERTAISKKPDETIKNELEQLKNEGKLTPELVFRDPYFLDFLGLKDTYSEKDLETAIIAELQRFIIELGNDFAFLSRQKRIMIDNRDYYIDLLFYHRRLKALVAIDLKLGEFEAEHKGKMELYLAWLEKHETVEGENPPVGLILCAGKNYEHVELLQLHKSNIKVAEYLTQLPPKEVLLEKFHKAIEIARAQMEYKMLDKD